MDERKSTRRAADEKVRELYELADTAEQAGATAYAEQLRGDALTLRHAEAQRLRALAETQDEIADIQDRLNTLIERHPSAFTLGELARQSVPARPLIERLGQLKGRAAILERSAA